MARKRTTQHDPERPDAEGRMRGRGHDATSPTVAPAPPTGDNTTPAGTPSKATQGYGTSQGASGAASGGADPGGATHIEPTQP